MSSSVSASINVKPSAVAGVVKLGTTDHVYIGLPQAGGCTLSVFDVFVKFRVTGVQKFSGRG